ncbi:MAG: LexA family protein [Janthinobacterium lividum]
MPDVLLIPVQEAPIPAAFLPVFSCRVSAGFPSPATDEIEGLFDLNKLLFHHPDATYLCARDG